jgi:hypothetical protein
MTGWVLQGQDWLSLLRKLRVHRRVLALESLLDTASAR